MMMTALKQTHLRISRLDRTLITTVVLLSSVFPVELFSNTPPAPKGHDGQYSGKQGQVLVVKVKGEEQATEVKGTFLSRTIPFFREFRPGEPAGYIGLLGIDMQDDPGTYELAVEVKQGEQAKQLSFNVLVAKEKFAVEHLKLPKEKVDLDEKSVARWKAEQEAGQAGACRELTPEVMAQQLRGTGEWQAHRHFRQRADHERQAAQSAQWRGYRRADGGRCRGDE